MIPSARDLKVMVYFAHCDLCTSLVDFSMSHGGRGECGMPTAPGLPLSVTLTGVCDGVDLASPSIKRNLNICQGTIDDAVGLNITNATLIILENDSSMSCKKDIMLRDIRLHSPNLLLLYLFKLWIWGGHFVMIESYLDWIASWHY